MADDHRHLVHADGTPFFYLGDTAWELFHRLNREEADRYLDDRARKGFTVIQAVVLAELDGLHTPNPYGDKPLVDDDPTRPNESLFPARRLHRRQGRSRSASTSACCPPGATSGTRSGA